MDSLHYMVVCEHLMYVCMHACVYECGVIALYTDSSTYICLSIFLAKALNKYMYL